MSLVTSSCLTLDQEPRPLLRRRQQPGRPGRPELLQPDQVQGRAGVLQVGVLLPARGGPGGAEDARRGREGA